MASFTFEDVIKLVDNSSVCVVNKQYIKDFFKWKYEQQQKAGTNTLQKLSTHYPIIDRWFDSKDWATLNEADTTQALFKLRHDKLKKKNGESFSVGSCSSYVKDHRQLLRWMFKRKIHKLSKSKTFDDVFGLYSVGEKEKFEHINEASTEPVIYSLDEAKKVINYLIKKNLQHIAVIFAVGWDTGLRPQEMFKLQLKHINWDNDRQKYWIYCQFPKKTSEKRNVDMYYFNDIVRDYLSNNMDWKAFKSGDSEAGDKELSSVCNFHFFRVIREALNELKIKKHKQFKTYDLRHSSIQKFCEVYKGNYNALALRYGWAFSKVGTRLEGYLARSQIGLPDATEQAHHDKIQDLETKYGDLFKKYEETIRLFKHLKR